MSAEAQAEITQLLGRWREGDSAAFQRLIPAVYPHLRDVAAGLMSQERGSHTLEPTALVHELFLRLKDQREPHWDDRAHFYTFCARMMRHLLIDHARRKSANRRGGEFQLVALTENLPWLQQESSRLTDLEQVLERLERENPRAAKLIDLRIFLGCSQREAAEVLQISEATATREWRMARAWLFQQLSPAAPA